VILALVVDPFAQQVVYFEPCKTNATAGTASIPKSNLYLGAAGLPGGPLHVGAGISTVAIGMQAAINNGVFDPENIQVKYNCNTGNCTFPESYSSLGFCSTCRDVSSDLKLTPFDKSSGRVNYTLPSGFSITSYMSVFAININGSVSSGVPGTNVQAIFAYNNTNTYGLQGTVCFEGDEWGCRGYGAAECDILPCVRSYDANIENGYLQENVLPNSEFSKFNTSNDVLFLWTTVDTSCLSSSEKTHLQNTGYRFDNDTRWSAYATNITSDAFFYQHYTMNLSDTAIINQYYTNQSLNPSCFNMIDYITLNSLDAYFDSIFSAVLPYDSYGYGTAEGSSYLKQIYNVGNVSFASFDSTFNNLTMSMTNFVRQSSFQLFGSNTTGQVIKQVTCVRVRWRWLTFPAILVALTLLFFVLLVVQTRFDTGGKAGANGTAGGNLVYKSSALAALVHGLDTKTQEQLDVTTRGSLDKVKKDAQTVYVKWTPTENGYKLAQTSPSGL